MPFNIDEFTASIDKTSGLARKSNFDVKIFSPPGLLGNEDFDTRDLTFRIDDVEFPGRSISVIDYQTYGPPERIAGPVVYSNVTMNLILSPDFREKEYFQKWQDIAIGKHRNYSRTFEERRSSFDIGYLDDYASDSIEIHQYNPATKEWVYRLRLIQAWPLTVSPIDASWEDDGVSRMQITFAYRHYEDEHRPIPEQRVSRSINVFDELNRLGGVGAIGIGEILTL